MTRSAVSTVVIVMAMEAEAAPIIAALDAEPASPGPTTSRLPFVRYVAERPAGRIVIAVNGVDPRHHVDNIATQPAVLNTWLTASAESPDLLVSAGTAGGYQRLGAQIGHVYLADRPFVFHDRRIALPGFDAYGVGGYPAADVSGLAPEIGARLGGVTTGNSLDETDTDRQRIESSGAVCKDMEAAAVAWVGELLAIPVTAVKSVTDLVDDEHPTEAEFARNFDTAIERLTEVVTALVDRSLGRSLASLARR